MKDSYWYRTSKGVLRVKRNDEQPSFWDLLLDDRPLRHNYRDPHEALHFAARSDFGDEILDRLLRYVHVPDDLELWNQG